MDELSLSHIRLLHLLPGQDSEPVHITLSQVSVSLLPSYEALSYTWGSQLGSNEDPHHIHIHGTSSSSSILPVTANLYLALQHLRSASSPRVLWIDAICINKANVTEKSAQVRIMKQIYRNASHVVIWLGPSTPMDTLAFKVLSHFSSVFERRGYFRFALWDYGNDGFPPSDAEEWIALLNLFQREWWLRVWVLQEAVMARKATVICGDLTAEWEIVLSVAVCFIDCEIIGRYDVVDQAPGVHAGRVIQVLRNRKDVPLLTLLRLTRLYQATDPRDNVFALLGLTTDNRDPDGKGSFIDYSVEANNLFWSLAVDHLTQGDSLEYLSYTGLSSAYPDSPLPSWVADWSYQNKRRTTLGANRPFRFHAAGDTTPKLRISPDKSILTIRGYKIGSISLLGSFTRQVVAPSPKTTDKEAFQAYLRYQNLIEKQQVKDLDYIISEDFHIPAGQTREDAIWRTLACDMTSRSQRVPSDLTGAYAWYRKYVACIDDEGKVNVSDFGPEDPGGVKFYSEGLMLDPYLAGAKMYLIARTLCAVSSGSNRYIGNVPEGTAVGDVICTFQGGTVPFVLREMKGEEGKDRFFFGRRVLYSWNYGW